MRKKYLITLIVILSVFIISMVIITVTKFHKTEPIETTVEHKYNATPTFTTTTVTETFEITEYNLQHIERLTTEQKANKAELSKLLNSDFVQLYYSGATIISAEILESSTEDTVFVKYKFKTADGVEESDTAVVTFDTYDTKNFMRCVSLEYYNYIMSGQNM